MTMKTDKAYGIRHKATKDIWHSPKGKKVWSRVNHAKNAWINGNDIDFYARQGIAIEISLYRHIVSGNRFDDQDLYEIFEYGTEHSEALELLKRVHFSDETDPYGDENLKLKDDIYKFLVSKKVV